MADTDTPPSTVVPLAMNPFPVRHYTVVPPDLEMKKDPSTEKMKPIWLPDVFLGLICKLFFSAWPEM